MALYSYTPEGNITDDFAAFMTRIVNDEKYRHECYKKACEHSEDMSVHMYGVMPDKLLDMVRPREEAETKAYRKAAYQPTTKSTAEKALSIVSKIFNPTLYSIQWKETTTSGKKLQDYTLEYYPEYNSVITFLQQTALKKMLSDPNGVMAVKPRRFDISDVQRPEPEAKIYGSKNIWYYDIDSFLIFLKKEEPGGGKGTMFYFCYYDAFAIVEFTVQKTGLDRIILTETAKYNHNFGEVPVWFLRGVPEALDNGVIYYRSFFEPAVPFWNLAINHESDLFGAYINHLHPLRAELAEECDYKQDGQRCKKGTLSFPDGRSIDCPGCHGSGYRSVKSPYGVYRYNREKLQSAEGGVSLEPVQYITVPTEPTRMLEERVDKLLEKGLYALNMDILNKIGENQSGIAKVIDRDELYDFLYKISSVMFDIHLSNIFYFFNKFMFGVSDGINAEKNLPEINKPVQFDISTALELIESLKAGKDAGVNVQYMREKQKQINDKEFASSPEIKQKLDLMIELDPAPEYDLDSIKLAVDSGFLPKEFAIIHTNIESFVDRALIEKKEGFYNLSKQQQMEILKKYAKELMEEMKSKLDDTEDAIEPAGNNSGGGQQPPFQKNNNNAEPVIQ